MNRAWHATLVVGMVMIAVAMSRPAVAQVYRCTASNGSIAFQDHPCSHAQHQKVLDVPSHPPPGYVPSSAASVAPPAPPTDTLPLPDRVPPPAPLPVMYACVGAVNGKHYLAHAPTPPYLAPLGVMGYPPQGLSQVYGAPGGVGMSAPEFSKPRIGGPRIAAGMTEVQDFCLPATHAQVCSYVQKQYDENHHELRLAMRNERPPFEQREKQLLDQLRNCR